MTRFASLTPWTGPASSTLLATLHEVCKDTQGKRLDPGYRRIPTITVGHHPGQIRNLGDPPTIVFSLDLYIHLFTPWPVLLSAYGISSSSALPIYARARTSSIRSLRLHPEYITTSPQYARPPLEFRRKPKLARDWTA